MSCHIMSCHAYTETNALCLVSCICLLSSLEEINNKEEEFKAYLEERRIPSTGKQYANSQQSNIVD